MPCLESWIKPWMMESTRRIEVITGRGGGIGPTKRRRGSLPKAQNPREHLGRRPARGRQSRFAECLAPRSRADLSPIRASLRAAGHVRAGDSGWRTNASPERVVDIASVASRRIEIEIAGARVTVIGSVAPELAQAIVAVVGPSPVA